MVFSRCGIAPALNERESKIGAYLYGRGLYENMAPYWSVADENPDAPEYEKEYARIWKSKPKIVFSKTLEHVEWNSTLVRGNIADVVKELKAQPGGDMTVGGADLALSFMQLDLIDEYALYIHPIILGGGKPMLGVPHDSLNLELVETHRFGSGVVLLRYNRVNKRQR